MSGENTPVLNYLWQEQLVNGFLHGPSITDSHDSNGNFRRSKCVLKQWRKKRSPTCWLIFQKQRRQSDHILSRKRKARFPSIQHASTWRGLGNLLLGNFLSIDLCINTSFSIQQAGKLLEKIFELKPEFLEIKTVVGTKYCKLKSREIPVSIFDELVKEKMASLAK